jgi:hypothetical protein
LIGIDPTAKFNGKGEASVQDPVLPMIKHRWRYLAEPEYGFNIDISEILSQSVQTLPYSR